MNKRRDIRTEHIAAQVLKDTLEGKNAAPRPTVPTIPGFRRLTFTVKRLTTIAYFVVFGFSVYLYPFWVFQKGTKWFGIRFGKLPDNCKKGSWRDAHFTFLIGGISILPYIEVLPPAQPKSVTPATPATPAASAPVAG